MKRQTFRQNQPADTPKEYYRRSLTIPFLDNIITELNSRFTKEHRIHSNGFLVVPTQVIDQPNWKDLTIKFEKAYHADLPNCFALGSELDRWETFWKNEYVTRKSIPDNIVLKDITSKKHCFRTFMLYYVSSWLYLHLQTPLNDPFQSFD